MAHHLVVVPQVVATHLIAAHIQEDHLLHVEILPVALRVDRQIDAMALHQDRLPTASNVVTVLATRVQVLIGQQVVRTVTATRVHLQIAVTIDDQVPIAPIVRPVHTETVIHVRRVIVQQVVHTAIVTHVALRVDRQIDAMALHHVHPLIEANVATVLATRVQVPIDQQVVRMVTVIHVRHQIDDLQVIDQQGVHTETEIHARVPVRLLIAQPVVHTVTATRVHLQIAVTIDVQVPIAPIVRPVHTATEIPARHQIVAIVVHLPIVHRVHTVTDQNVVMIAALQVIAQPVVQTVTEIRAQVPIVRVVARRVDRLIDAMIVPMDREIHEHQQISPAEATHTVAIVHALAMTVTPVRLRVTANAVGVPIVPEAAFPMIAKNVHAVALAKSA
jgi:hypothetical protein